MKQVIQLENLVFRFSGTLKKNGHSRKIIYLVICVEAIVLCYFDPVSGPIITHTLSLDNPNRPAKIYPDLEQQIKKLIDIQMEDGFFSHSFKIYNTANFYFTIPSEWARGNHEMLCLSIISRSKKLDFFKAILSTAVMRLKEIPDLYQAFYRLKQGNGENFEKKQDELKRSMLKLYQDVLDGKKQSIKNKKKRDQTRDQARDKARDYDRDRSRDHARDLNRDQVRDHARDLDRDQVRDHARDHDRDHAHDHDRKSERDRGPESLK